MVPCFGPLLALILGPYLGPVSDPLFHQVLSDLTTPLKGLTLDFTCLVCTALYQNWHRTRHI